MRHPRSPVPPARRQNHRRVRGTARCGQSANSKHQTCVDPIRAGWRVRVPGVARDARRIRRFLRKSQAPEEEEILPAAHPWLTEEDWNEADEAFGTNRD